MIKEFDLEQICGLFTCTESQAAVQLQCSCTTLKKYSRLYGIKRWPFRKIRSLRRQIRKIGEKYHKTMNPKLKQLYFLQQQSIEKQIVDIMNPNTYGNKKGKRKNRIIENPQKLIFGHKNDLHSASEANTLTLQDRGANYKSYHQPPSFPRIPVNPVFSKGDNSMRHNHQYSATSYSKPIPNRFENSNCNKYEGGYKNYTGGYNEQTSQRWKHFPNGSYGHQTPEWNESYFSNNDTEKKSPRNIIHSANSQQLSSYSSITTPNVNYYQTVVPEKSPGGPSPPPPLVFTKPSLSTQDPKVFKYESSSSSSNTNTNQSNLGGYVNEFPKLNRSLPDHHDIPKLHFISFNPQTLPSFNTLEEQIYRRNNQ